MKWTNELVKKVERFIEIKNHGYYCDSKEIANVYNEVLEKHVAPSNCGSCNRARISELEGALNNFKAKMAQESVPEVKVDNTPQDENKAVTEAGNNLKSKRKK